MTRYPTEDDGSGRLRVQRPVVDAATARVVWRPNDFPYYLEDGIEHNCVWFERGSHTEAELAAVIAAHRPPETYDTAFWVNPLHLMSVPELHHAHVLSRRKPQEDASERAMTRS